MLGHAAAREIGDLYALDTAQVQEHLLDAEARGWVRRPTYSDGVRWSMTDLGRQHAEQLLREEVDEQGTRQSVIDAFRRFLPLNQRLGPLMTRWQLRPTEHDPLAFNDHRDPRYDQAILRELDRLVIELGQETARLATQSRRLAVHQPRLETALARAWEGDHRWVDSPELPSMNLAWIQLHEDLLATLGLTRGQEPEDGA